MICLVPLLHFGDSLCVKQYIRTALNSAVIPCSYFFYWCFSLIQVCCQPVYFHWQMKMFHENSRIKCLIFIHFIMTLIPSRISSKKTNPIFSPNTVFSMCIFVFIMCSYFLFLFAPFPFATLVYVIEYPPSLHKFMCKSECQCGTPFSFNDPG